MNSERKQSTGSISSDASSTRQRTSSYPNGIYFSNSMDESQHRELAYMEKRSAHNALERQRREGLNSKYQELAHVLPTLQEVKRPSKNMIVTKSLEFVSKAKEREEEYKDELKALQKEHAQLQRQAKLTQSRKKQRQKKSGLLQPVLPVHSSSSSSSSRLKPQVRDLSPVLSQKRQREQEPETVQKRFKPDTRRSSASSSCATVQSATQTADLSVHSGPSCSSSVGDEQRHEHPSYTPILSSSPPPLQVTSIPAIRMPVVHTGTHQQQQQQQQPLLNLDMFLQNDTTFDDSNHLWNYPPY